MKNTIGLLVAALMAFISHSAFAAEQGGYVGAGLGIGATSIQNFPTPGTTTNFTASAFRLLGGYQFNQNFAVEAEYFDIGSFSNPIVSIKTSGFGVSAVGILPLDKISLYGKVGITNVSTTATAGPGFILLVPPSESKTGVSLGVGMNIDISSNAALRLSIDSYQYSALQGNITGRVGVYGVAGIIRF